MRTLYTDAARRLEMGEAAYASVKDRFTWARCGQRAREAFAEVAGG
jgi:hypothetical protein